MRFSRKLAHEANWGVYSSIFQGFQRLAYNKNLEGRVQIVNVLVVVVGAGGRLDAVSTATDETGREHAVS